MNNRSGIPGMALHQAISFFSPMISVPEAPAVFWPGCALLNLDPALLRKTMEILARTEPGIRLAAGCCGQPSYFLFPEKYPAYREKLELRLKKSGIKRIYTACPNCTRQLCGICGIQVIPIWSVLARIITREDVCGPGIPSPKDSAELSGFIWHDPCPTGMIRSSNRPSGLFFAFPAFRSWNRSTPAPIPCAAETSI